MAQRPANSGHVRGGDVTIFLNALLCHHGSIPLCVQFDVRRLCLPFLTCARLALMVAISKSGLFMRWRAFEREEDQKSYMRGLEVEEGGSTWNIKQRKMTTHELNVSVRVDEVPTIKAMTCSWDMQSDRSVTLTMKQPRFTFDLGSSDPSLIRFSRKECTQAIYRFVDTSIQAHRHGDMNISSRSHSSKVIRKPKSAETAIVLIRGSSNCPPENA